MSPEAVDVDFGSFLSLLTTLTVTTIDLATGREGGENLAEPSSSLHNFFLSD